MRQRTSNIGFTQPQGSGAGFTLFETVISVGLMLIIVSGLGGFVLTIQNTRNQLASIQEVEGNARMALSIMSERIRNARSITLGSSIFGSDPGVLSLEMDNPAANPTVFRLTGDNGALQMQEGASDPLVLTSDEVTVDTLIFTLLSQAGERENIRINLTVGYAAAGDSFASYEHQIQTSISLRQ